MLSENKDVAATLTMTQKSCMWFSEPLALQGESLISRIKADSEEQQMGKFYLKIVSCRFILDFHQKSPEKATFMCYFIKWNPIGNLGFLRLKMKEC